MPGGNRSCLGNELFEQALYLPLVTVPNVAANATAIQTFAVPGVLLGDAVSWNQQGVITGLAVDNVWVSAAGVVSFYWSNTTVSAINGSAAQPFLLTIARPENASLGLAALPSSIQ